MSEREGPGPDLPTRKPHQSSSIDLAVTLMQRLWFLLNHIHSEIHEKTEISSQQQVRATACNQKLKS